MKTVQQIIQETYNTKANFREQIKLYDLSLDEVGVITYSHNPKNSDAIILDSYKSDSPIVLLFSKEDDKVVSQSVSL